MTITINLEPEKEARLHREAARAGRPAEQLVQDFVSRGLDESDSESSQQNQPQPVQTLAEALAGRIGTQHSGRGDLSQNTGKAFARLLAEKHKANQK